MVYEAGLGASDVSRSRARRRGENLAGTKVAPIELSDMTRVVYAPHTYGPGVYDQPYFSAPSFPINMRAIWDEHWAFAAEETGQPLILGEFGGVYRGKVRMARRGPHWLRLHDISRRRPSSVRFVR